MATFYDNITSRVIVSLIVGPLIGPTVKRANAESASLDSLGHQVFTLPLAEKPLNTKIMPTKSNTPRALRTWNHDTSRGDVITDDISEHHLTSDVRKATYPTVLDYNASGNGTADDAPAFEAAAHSGTYIRVPDLIYNMSHGVSGTPGTTWDIDGGATFLGKGSIGDVIDQTLIHNSFGKIIAKRMNWPNNTENNLIISSDIEPSSSIIGAQRNSVLSRVWCNDPSVTNDLQDCVAYAATINAAASGSSDIFGGQYQMVVNRGTDAAGTGLELSWKNFGKYNQYLSGNNKFGLNIFASGTSDTNAAIWIGGNKGARWDTGIYCGANGGISGGCVDVRNGGLSPKIPFKHYSYLGMDGSFYGTSLRIVGPYASAVGTPPIGGVSLGSTNKGLIDLGDSTLSASEPAFQMHYGSNASADSWSDRILDMRANRVSFQYNHQGLATDEFSIDPKGISALTLNLLGNNTPSADSNGILLNLPKLGINYTRSGFNEIHEYDPKKAFHIATALKTNVSFNRDGSTSFSDFVSHTVLTNLTTTGDSQSSALSLISTFNTVTNCPMGSGAVLPNQASAGVDIWVLNRCDKAFFIYPSVGIKTMIEDFLPENPVKIQSGATKHFLREGRDIWRQLQ